MPADPDWPQIAPPEPTADRTPPVIPGDWHTFRVRFWPLFGIGSVAISAACLIALARFLVYPSPYPKIYIVGLGIAEGMVLAALAAAVDYLVYRTGVNASGILIRRSGKSRSYSWEGMESCRRIRFPFISYLKVRSEGRSLWLPLFHKEQDELEREIIELAPPGNPLRSYFEAK